MRSTELDLDLYDTDKVSHSFLERYDPIFRPFINDEITLLEIGVKTGGSVLMWHDYFPLGSIVGIDINLPKHIVAKERLQLFQGSQADVGFLSDVADRVAPGGYDIIIDDASHIGTLTKTAFWHLFDNHLKEGGIYAIEDWGTGYLDDWPDGRGMNSGQPILSKARSLLVSLIRGREKVSWPCHSYGMVGFIKELIDEQGAADVTTSNLAGKHPRTSKFESMLITPGIVFVKKAKQPCPILIDG